MSHEEFAIINCVRDRDLDNLKKCFEPNAVVRAHRCEYRQEDLAPAIRRSMPINAHFYEPHSSHLDGFMRADAEKDAIPSPKRSQKRPPLTESPDRPLFDAGSEIFADVVLTAGHSDTEQKQQQILEIARFLIAQGAAPSRHHITALTNFVNNPDMEYTYAGYSIHPGRTDHHLSELIDVMEQGRATHKRAIDDMTLRMAQSTQEGIEDRYAQWRMCKTACAQVISRAKNDQAKH